MTSDADRVDVNQIPVRIKSAAPTASVAMESASSAVLRSLALRLRLVSMVYVSPLVALIT
jgi:hypothetical protein